MRVLRQLLYYSTLRCLQCFCVQGAMGFVITEAQRQAVLEGGIEAMPETIMAHLVPHEKTT